MDNTTQQVEEAVVEEIEVRPALWTRDYILICLSSMFIFLAFHMYLPTLPLYMEKIGGLSGLAGWPLAGLTIGAVLIRPLAGWALDTYGRKVILFGGIIFFLLPSVIYIWMIPAMILVMFRFVQGLGWGIANTASNTVASDIVPRKRLGEGMGFFTITLTLPLAISPALGIWLIEEHSFSLMFTIAALFIVISMLLLLLIKFPHFEKRTVKVALVFMEKAALRPAMIILALTFTYSSVISFFPLYAFQQGIPSTGLFFTALALSTMVIRPLSGIIVDRMGKNGYTFVVILGTIGLFIAMFLIARVATIPQMILGGAIYGAGFGFLQPAMLALCLKSVPPEKRGGANATFWTAYDIGVATGSILWGPLAVTLGYQTMFQLTLVPVAIACFMYFMRKKTPVSEF